VIHVPQHPEALARLSARVHGMDNFTLAGFHDLVSLSGSLILGFAAKMDYLSPDAIWKLSRLDEDWQIELWGSDDEAEAMAETKRLAFLHAKTFVDLSWQTDCDESEQTRCIEGSLPSKTACRPPGRIKRSV
jgi:chaperone required for assembly of F1-ATPase